MATRKPTQNSILIEIKKKQNISPRITINFPQSLGTFAIDFFLRHQLPQRLRRAVFYSWLPSPPTQKWARWASATSWGPSRQGPHGPPGCKISVGIDHLVVSVASLKKKPANKNIQKHDHLRHLVDVKNFLPNNIPTYSNTLQKPWFSGGFSDRTRLHLGRLDPSVDFVVGVGPPGTKEWRASDGIGHEISGTSTGWFWGDPPSWNTAGCKIPARNGGL